MLERLDPRLFLSCCVRCNERGAPLCADCASVPPARVRTPAGHPVLALGHYESPVGDRVRRLKYGDETHLAFPLGRALRQLGAAAFSNLADAVLVPVPLHPERLASRGYNQAALIARALAWRGGPRLDLTLIERRAHGVAQARLSGRERRVNLIAAFVVRKLAQQRPVVFLIDDVVTTGSTVDACASALLDAGAIVGGILSCAIADEKART